MASPLAYPLKKGLTVVNKYSILFKLFREYKTICGENR
jgi:hypothetical protein